MCLFKQKLKLEEQTIINLLKHFNISVPKGHGMQLDWPELKKPDFLFTVNIRLMQKMHKVLNDGNKGVKPELGSNYFKFYVGQGNNHSTIRQIIKRRSWWHRQKTERFIGQGELDDEEEDCNEEQQPGAQRGAHFIWTHWRKTELSDHLKQSNKSNLIYNRMEDNYHLANKKALFMNVVNYYKALNHDPFEVAIPLTFHIKS